VTTERSTPEETDDRVQEAWKALYADRRTLEVSTAAFDPRKLGVGSSPFLGDISSSMLTIPSVRPRNANNVPLTTLELQRRRYMYRLCGLGVPANGWCRVRGVRQYLEIGTTLEVTGASQEQWKFHVRKQVKSPNWSFQDGNVSWHLRFIKCGPYDTKAPPFGTTFGNPATVRQLQEGTDAALLYDVLPPLYVPPNGGLPPGDGVGSLGTFRDIRYGWEKGALDTLDVAYTGPGTIVLIATVLQTDPATRPTYPDRMDTSILEEEDRFVIEYERQQTPVPTFYTGIAGAILADVGPLQNNVFPISPVTRSVHR